jgi:hypothetical protein
VGGEGQLSAAGTLCKEALPPFRRTCHLPLTRHQLRALEAISIYQSSFGRSPTIAELASLLGSKSISSTQKTVGSLVAKGRLMRPFGGRRILILVTDHG